MSPIPASPHHKASPFYILIAISLVIIQFIVGYDSSVKNSQTYDEAVHLAAGYSYYKTGNFKMNGTDHPPLAKLIAAAPLAIFLKPDFIPASHPWRSNMQGNQYRIGDYFLYKNRISAEKLLTLSRATMLILSAGFSFAFFFIVKQLYDEKTAVIALSLWVLCPPILANSFLITTDFTATIFYFLTFYFLYEALNSKAGKSFFFTILTSMSMGLALAAKFSNILILPSIIIILTILILTKKNSLPDISIKLALIIIFAFLTLWLCYFLSSDIQIYFEGLQKIITSASGEKPRPAYLFQRRSIGGWPYYFAAALLLKTPAAILIALLIFLISAIKNSALLTHLKRDFIFWGIPSLIFFITASFSKIQIGHRHILPIYPLMIMWAGAGLGHFIHYRRKIVLIIMLILFIGFTAFEFWARHPWHLSYISTIFPEAKKHGEKYLLDSNYDWGQGLRDLSLFLKSKGVDTIYLSYFGTGDPDYFGIKYYPIGFISNVERRGSQDFNITNQPHKYLAISATNLYGVYYQNTEVFSSFKKIQPIYRAADSIFVYDLTNNNAANYLGGILRTYISDEEEATKLKKISSLSKNLSIR